MAMPNPRKIDCGEKQDLALIVQLEKNVQELMPTETGVISGSKVNLLKRGIPMILAMTGIKLTEVQNHFLKLKPKMFVTLSLLTKTKSSFSTHFMLMVNTFYCPGAIPML